MKAVAALAIAVVMAFGGTAYASTSSSYLSDLNQERTSHGLAPLHVSADLVSVAQSWTDVLARTGVLRHNPHLGSDVPNWWSVGENVGMGADLPDIARAFWNSPDHRSNILDPRYTDVGIATARSDGRIWITVVFRQEWHHITHRATPVHHTDRVLSPSPRQVSPPLLMRGRWFVRKWLLR